MRKASVFRILLLVALISGLAAYAAVPASAQPPFDTQNFLPDDTNVDPSGRVLSDKSDGTDALAHLTNVSTADTTFVTWYVCPSGTVGVAGGFGGGGGLPAPGGGTVTQAELGACQVIGTDSEGRRPAGGNEFAPTDEAYEFFWDIPGTLDLRTRDIVAVACTGAPGTVDVEAPNQNCVTDAEEDIALDDAQSGGAAVIQTSTAEMISICTADVVGGPGVGTDVCEVGGTGAGTDAEVAARFEPFPHGSNVPNEGFVLRVTTDAETDLLNIGIETPADAQNDPSEPFAFVTLCNSLTLGVTSNLFECVVPAGSTPDNAELAIVAFDFDDISGSGLCDVSEDGTQNPPADIGNLDSTGADFPRCKLDVHYAVSSVRQATGAAATFVTPAPGEPTPPGGPSPAAGECEPADTQRSNQLGDAEFVRFCTEDQFGDPFVGDVTFESTGPEGSGFTSCPGTAHDHDADGRNEHCHTTTDADGTAQVTINNFTDAFATATPGTQTVTACVDPDPIGTNAAPGAGSGCADETVTATVTKNWVAVPTHVHLVFGEGGAIDPADPCHTGDTFRENEVGDTDTLLVCTMDGQDNPATTQQQDGGRLQFFIVPSGGGELTATRFEGQVPSETDDNGQATATIEAFRQGNDVITVQLQSDTGGTIDAASVQKRVTQGEEPDGVPEVCRTNADAIVGTPNDDQLLGTGDDDVICALGGDDTVSARGGDDLVLAGGGNDTARGGGGNDQLRGGGGRDTLAGGGGKDILRGGGGNDTLKGNKLHDTLRGGGGNDTLRGGRGNDTMNGGRGRDRCRDNFGSNVFRSCER